MKAIIPKTNKYRKRYYHFISYIKNILLDNNVDIIEKGECKGLVYSVILDGKEICFDYSDNHPLQSTVWVNKGIPYFKFHWHKELHKNYKNLFSFTGLTFHDWNNYRKIKKE